MSRSSFKQTPIGLIPREWEVASLGDKKITEELFYGITAKAVDKDTGVKMLRTTDIKEYSVDWEKLPFCEITERRGNLTRYLLKRGDLIVARAGTVGVSILVDRDFDNVIFGSYLIKVKLKPSIDPKFVHYFFQSSLYWKHLQKAQGSTLKNINLPLLKSLKIPLPPLPEQRKIAEILSTVDQAIQKVDEAIARTERLKRGLMQRLLTRGIGHREFKDTEIGRIPKEWEVVRLGDISKVSSGNTAPQDKKYFENGKYPFIRVQHLSTLLENKYPIICDFVNDLAVEELKLKKFKKGSIIFPKSGESIRLEKRAILREDSYVVNHLVVVEVFSNNVDTNFLYYYLSSLRTSSYLSKTTMPSLNLSVIKSFLIPLPPLPEQRRIAEILSTVDKKNEQERKRKEKLERIKKGLMNDLLTGKKRVKYEDTNTS